MCIQLIFLVLTIIFSGLHQVSSAIGSVNSTAQHLKPSFQALVSKGQSESKWDETHVYEEADVMVGVLLPIHKQYDGASQASASLHTLCGPFWEQYGIHRLEALFFILDQLNNASTFSSNYSVDPSADPNRSFSFTRRTGESKESLSKRKLQHESLAGILPAGLRLGVEVRDECWQTSTALHQSISFVWNSIGQQSQQSERRRLDAELANNRSSALSSATQAADKLCPSENTPRAPIARRRKPVRVVIGPGSSNIAIEVLPSDTL